ncbi:galactose-1-phosphate uridylyltransferase [Methanohalophilus halophilus]|uniref:DUF4921 family protein n=1 Tax=Methanohalophilus halophilus TaxID=2177 RepID=A0A1L3Q4C2_9EURY|nr:DUF4931 domain-containing protein [Methanohalophilus halophilus]APH39729.1 sulfate adenylyltransferase [Methanohalophilus halophilus]RNI08932.1 DUF4921 family protein [Methanohalophilus halophilus]SDW37845.1 UDPglucose--hexose-1-phosphate uridylyltransferase [Methanohalophilus halophilus]
MSQIRKHYFMDEYCIIAPRRNKRPSDYADSIFEKKTSECVFCEGYEDNTPPATAVYKNEEILQDTDNSRIKNWGIRCFPNRYPALSSKSERPSDTISTTMEGYGFHEVIVETPKHSHKVSNFSDDEIMLFMKAYQDRVTYYQSLEKIAYVSLFKNEGQKAGASIAHAHSQLIALPFIPPELKREVEVIKASETCPYCNIIVEECGGPRLLYHNEEFIVIAPYFSKVPYELWILPQRHINHISDFTEDMLGLLGDAIIFSLSSINNILKEVPYNYMFYQLQDDPKYHFNLRIQPVTSIAAGFEKNTGIYINTMPPENAVQQLKNNIS